jgi:tetratricopeptide (TPR) repeat protein/tRNA A-37 threonylcarbamoyl transferase component Bud32
LVDGILLLDSDPLIGTTLDDRYQILGFLGQGGMSLVYKARHVQLDRVVAVKLLKSQMLSHSANLKRFRREAQAASLLQHTNINAIYAFGVADDRPYLILEFLEGRSFSQLLAEESPLAPERAVSLFSQICDGLEHARAHGVVHRDLKPSNIVITRETEAEVVKIVDFGTAKLSGDVLIGNHQQLTQAGELFGTLQYMSPEQKKGAESDHRSDLYAVVYMLAESVRAEGALPVALGAIVSKGLAENPEDRFQSAAALKLELQKISAAGYSEIQAPADGQKSKSGGKIKYVTAGVMLLLISTLLLASNQSARRVIDLMAAKLIWHDPERIVKAADSLAQEEAVAGDHLAAVRTYNREVMPVLPRTTSETRAILLGRLGQEYVATGNVAAAYRCLKQINAICTKLPAIEGDVLRSRVQLDVALASCGTLDVARLQELMGICNAHKEWALGLEIGKTLLAAKPGPNAACRLTILGNACEASANLRDMSAFADYVNRSIELIDREHLENSKEAPRMWLLKGNLLREHGHLKRSQKFLQLALAHMQPNHPDLGYAWLSMGISCHESGQLTRATMYLEKAVQSLQTHKSPSPETLQLAMAQAQLGAIYKTQDLVQKSEAAFLAAIQLLGVTAYTSEDWLDIPEKLMGLYKNNGRWRDALRLGKAIITSRQASAMMHLRGTDTTAYQVSLLYLMDNNYGAAERYARIALEHARTKQMAIMAKSLVSFVYLKSDDIDRAGKLSHQAYEEMRAGKYAVPEMVMVYDNESQLLVLQGRTAEALQVVDRAFGTYGKKLVGSDGGVNLALRRLDIYSSTGQDEKFRQYARILEADLHGKPGEDEPRLRELQRRFHERHTVGARP